MRLRLTSSPIWGIRTDGGPESGFSCQPNAIARNSDPTPPPATFAPAVLANRTAPMAITFRLPGASPATLTCAPHAGTSR